MTRPEDIPEDVWEIARELLGEPDTVTRPKNIERAARVLMAYGQRRADEARESAAQVADAAAVEADRRMANAIFDYTKRNYASAHVTCKRLATAIRNQK
jgi:hypothetical protein